MAPSDRPLPPPLVRAASGQLTATQTRDPLAPGLLASLPEPPRKVAILKASRIGDFINLTPALRALKRALPRAEFTLITLPMLRPLADRLSYIDRCVDFPGYPGLAEQFFDPRAALAFFAWAQSQAFDLAVQFQGSGVYANPFLLMLGARRTAGFIRPGDPPGRLAAALPWPDSGHEIERNLALTDFLGAPADGLETDFPLRAEDIHEAERLLAGLARPLVAIHASARDATRRWPLERFARAAALLHARRGGTLLLLGEQRDGPEMEAAVHHLGLPYANLAGHTSLPVTGAILERLAVFITNDTGPAHIAYARRARTVTIFGGGDPARNGPFRPGPFRVVVRPIRCRPCETGDCPIGLKCLREITVEQVVTAAEEVMAQ